MDDGGGMPLGTLVADERIYVIDRLYLSAGAFWVQASRTFERAEPASEIREYAVFGRDGGLVWRSGPHWRAYPLPKMEAGATLTISIQLDLVGKEAAGTGVASGGQRAW